MAILLLVFALSIGTGTFIENDFGTPASKALVYNAKWFELMLFFLFINLIANIIRHKMYRLSKWSILLFHLAFVFILLGGGVTRYFAEEGVMHIREGQTSNTAISDKTYFRLKVHDKKLQYNYDKPVYLNPLFNAGFSHAFTFNNVDIGVSFIDYIPNAIDTLISDPKGSAFIELVTTDGNGRKINYLEKGHSLNLGTLPIFFGKDSTWTGVRLIQDQNGISIISPFDIGYLSMNDRSEGVLAAGEVHPFKNRMLYQINGVSVVFTSFHQSARQELIASKSEESASGTHVMIVDLVIDGIHQKVNLKGGAGFISVPTELEKGDLNFQISYGSKYIYLPFYLQLIDFQMDKYPGSMSPESYASEVVLIDQEAQINQPHRIYMNHVLDHRGYRFFQSSYDQDELGTILSVNRDFWGTWISYIGYMMMGIGMFFTLFIHNSRFSKQKRKLDVIRVKKAALTLWIGVCIGIGQVYGQEIPVPLPLSQSESFGALQIQDYQGRMKPINTLSSEILRKVSRSSSFQGLTPDQVLLGMLYVPQKWQMVDMIVVKNPSLRKKIGMDASQEKHLFAVF